jgi:hypothetical protein
MERLAGALPMSHYFESVADGRWKVTDTVGQVLGSRKPQTYAQWLQRNLPEISSRKA